MFFKPLCQPWFEGKSILHADIGRTCKYDIGVMSCTHWWILGQRGILDQYWAHIGVILLCYLGTVTVSKITTQHTN